MCLSRNGKAYILKSCQLGTWFHLANQVPTNWPQPGSLTAVFEAPQDTTKQVTCGGHKAMGCAACPQGNGASWCNADCSWLLGKCIAKSDADKVNMQTPKKCCSGIRE